MSFNQQFIDALDLAGAAVLAKPNAEQTFYQTREQRIYSTGNGRVTVRLPAAQDWAKTHKACTDRAEGPVSFSRGAGRPTLIEFKPGPAK